MSKFNGVNIRLKMVILYKGDKNVDIKFTLRLPEELHQDIASYSNKHNISMNTLILNCIEYAMANREEEDK